MSEQSNPVEPEPRRFSNPGAAKAHEAAKVVREARHAKYEAYLAKNPSWTGTLEEYERMLIEEHYKEARQRMRSAPSYPDIPHFEPLHTIPPGQLRPSVMVSSEWYKNRYRDDPAWPPARLAALQRDNYTCTYCRFRALKFMQVNHIGAEDDHSLENLETICKACHDTQHIGACSGAGSNPRTLSVLDSTADQVDIVRATRQLVLSGLPWPDIEHQIIKHFLAPGGNIYDQDESIAFANRLVNSIPPGSYRAYLPYGLAVVFHEAPPWTDPIGRVWPERIHRWGGR